MVKADSQVSQFGAKIGGKILFFRIDPIGKIEDEKEELICTIFLSMLDDVQMQTIGMKSVAANVSPISLFCYVVARSLNVKKWM